MPKEYLFPILDSNVLRKMTETILSIVAQTSDIEKPTAEFVRRVYQSALTILLGGFEYRESPLNQLDFPQLYSDTAPRIAFFAKVQSIFSRMTITDFCFEDLTRPDGTRFRTQLSGLMNFMKFRAERLAVLQRYQQAQSEIVDERTSINESLIKKTYELENIKALHEKERKQAEALEPEKQRMRKICQQLNKKHDELLSQQSLSMTKVKKLKDDLASVTFDLDCKTQERNNLQDQIVQSPDELQAAISGLQERLEDTKRRGRELREKDDQCTEDISTITEMGKQLEKNIELLRKIERSKSEKKESSKRLAGIKIKLDEGSRIYNQLAEEINTLRKSYEEVSKELDDARHKLAASRAEAEEILRQKRNEINKQQSKNEEVKSCFVDRGNEEVKKLQAETQSLKEKHRMEVDSLVSKLNALNDSFLQWAARTSTMFKEDTPSI